MKIKIKAGKQYGLEYSYFNDRLTIFIPTEDIRMNGILHELTEGSIMSVFNKLDIPDYRFNLGVGEWLEHILTAVGEGDDHHYGNVYDKYFKRKLQVWPKLQGKSF